jgi:hypothetical protein
MRPALVAAAAALLALPHPGYGKTEIECRQKDREIKVDGDASEWNETLTVFKDAGFSCGLMNDSEYLYVAVVATDRQVVRQIMLAGLYMWFDEKGKQEKNFGVYFPIGLRESGEAPPAPTGEPGEPAASGPPASRPTGRRPGNPDSLATAFFESARDFMLFSPVEQEWQRADVGSLGDAEAVASYRNHVLVLEYRVPLARRGAGGYGIGAAPGSEIGMGLESPQIQFFQARHHGPPGEGGSGDDGTHPGGWDSGARGGEQGGAGGSPGMGGHHGGWGGGAGGGWGGRPGESEGGGNHAPHMSKPIKFWMSTNLSKG